MARLYDERFQWPLTLAFVFLLAETLISTQEKKCVDVMIRNILC